MINRQKLIEELEERLHDWKMVKKADVYNVIKSQPPADQWIPFTMEYDEGGWCMLTCPLPEDGEEIMVTDGRYVWEDTFMNDGEECWLDSSNKALVEEVTAWQPKPEPYKGETNDR